jgi:hypothetical protein
MRRTITYRFNKFKDKSIGAIPTLSKALRGMKYGRRIINDAFNKFVPKSEFAGDERDMILEDLYHKNETEQVAEIPLLNKDIKNE